MPSRMLKLTNSKAGLSIYVFRRWRCPASPQKIMQYKALASCTTLSDGSLFCFYHVAYKPNVLFGSCWGCNLSINIIMFSAGEDSSYGACGYLLLGLSIFIIIVTFPIAICACVKVCCISGCVYVGCIDRISW